MSDNQPFVAHIALLGIKVYGSDAITASRIVLKSLSSAIDYQKISSIYRVKRTEKKPFHSHDLRKIVDFEGYSFAITGLTSLTPLELIDKIENIETDKANQILLKNLSINLLAYENVTMMTQNLTLPHPEFHSKPEILFPASEVWGDYYHPVLKKSLQNLTREFANLRWGEFHEQGKTLLDF